LPLFWTIDSKRRWVELIAAGTVTRDDVTDCLEAVSGAQALGYRKLFDGRETTCGLSDEELVAAGAEVRSYHDGNMGPLAVLFTPEQTQRLARLLGILASARRPMRIFTSRMSARRWLVSLP
jgi:uncharacterized protein (DUF2384 family)